MINEKTIECKDGQCSFNITGKQFFLQKWYHCITCFPFDTNKGCCESCKSICHKGHYIEDRGLQLCFCDCGFGDCPISCKCKKLQNTQEISEVIITNDEPSSEEVITASSNHEEDQKNEVKLDLQPKKENISKNESSLFLRSLKNPNRSQKTQEKSPPKQKRFHLYV